MVGQGALTNGFFDPVHESQQVFRRVMDATARPGSLHALAADVEAPAPLLPLSGSIALALFDHDTPIWLDQAVTDKPDVADWLRFYTGSPIVADAARAAFAIVSHAPSLPAFDVFALGTPEYPDRSTTVVIQVKSLHAGEEFILRGPGIKSEQRLRVEGLPADFASRMTDNRALFPRGVDLILVSPDHIVALPRTVILTAAGAQ